jgi:hypothetical protein
VVVVGTSQTYRKPPTLALLHAWGRAKRSGSAWEGVEHVALSLRIDSQALPARAYTFFRQADYFGILASGLTPTTGANGAVSRLESRFLHRHLYDTVFMKRSIRSR